MSVRGIIRYSDSPEAVMRKIASASRLALEAAAEKWHHDFLPKHFTVQGGKEYGYAPRSGDDEPPRLTLLNGRDVTNLHYSWRKRRIQHHNKPLVWSGTTEEMAETSYRVGSSATSGTITSYASMAVPTYFYYNRTKSNGGRPPIDKPDELTRTTPDEQLVLEAVARQTAQDIVNGPATPLTVVA